MEMYFADRFLNFWFSLDFVFFGVLKSNFDSEKHPKSRQSVHSRLTRELVFFDQSRKSIKPNKTHFMAAELGY